MEALFGGIAQGLASSSGPSAFTAEVLTKNTPLSPVVARHLGRVYQVLGALVIAAAAGCAVHLFFNVGGFLTFFANLGLLLWYRTIPIQDVQKRTQILLASALALGATLGPLVEVAIAIDEMVIFQALMGTAALFACFSAAAMFAEKRLYVYLIGVMGTMASTMLLFMFFNMFFRSAMADSFVLYGGLLMASGFVIVDTQVIIEKAESGIRDHVSDALALFNDFVRLFVRVLVVLLKNAEKKKKNDRR